MKSTRGAIGGGGVSVHGTNASLSLHELIPWSSSDTAAPKTFMIYDCIESDGRFLFYDLTVDLLMGHHHMAPPLLAKKSPVVQPQRDKHTGAAAGSQILWLSCAPMSEKQILHGLQKMGLDTTAFKLKEGGTNNDHPLTLRMISVEVAQQISQTEETNDFKPQQYLQQLYQDIQDWLKKTTTDEHHQRWILFDDLSSMAVLLGEKLVTSFVHAINHHLTSHYSNESVALMMRCCMVRDEEIRLKEKPDWFGAGATTTTTTTTSGGSRSSKSSSWEQALVEIVDAVIDVLPLPSGYSREAHGRIIYTEKTLVSSTTKAPQRGGFIRVANFCITDSKVLAFPISDYNYNNNNNNNNGAT